MAATDESAHGVGEIAREEALARAESAVAQHSAELKKELRLRDLVGSQVMYIVGITWIGTAGKLGPPHVVYWIPAVLLFYVPSAIVVVHLSREMPLEGGLYQWAKLRFGEMAGFLVAVNLWSSLLFGLAATGSQLASALSYTAGTSSAWLAESHAVALGMAVLFLGGLSIAAALGLGLAKRIHNAGSYALFALYGAMVCFAVPRWLHGEATTAPVAFTAPALSLLNLNLLGKMGFGAFCGFDGTAVFAGEVRDPNVARTIRRSVWVAAPIIVVLYVVGTAAALAFTRPDDLDLIAPPLQAISRGAHGMGARLVPVAALLMILGLVGNGSVLLNAGVRLPMVAGWDDLLPPWLSRLHPRFKTPVGSITFLGATALLLAILGTANVGAQEAYQLLFSANLVCWALTYLVMFAIPIVTRGHEAALTVRIAAASGLAMTFLFVVLSIFPVVDVVNVAAFAMKLGGVVAAINVAGALYFVRARLRRSRLARAA